MNILNTNKFFIIIFLLFTVLFAIQRIRETFLHPKRGGEIRGKYSLPALTFVYVLVCSAAVLELLLIKRRLNVIITCLGIFLYIVAFFLRSWAFRTLGEYFSPHIEITKDQPLIIDGPYRFMRHPIYLGVIIELISFVLIPNSYYALLLAVFIYLPVLLVRMHQEEIAMIERFGLTYLQYKKEVNALLPLKRYSR
jgi:protein-S-isoprenylcysteine O-methyltransferase Ste14